MSLARTESVQFPGPAGVTLSGRVEHAAAASPGHEAASAVFAHCFTCGKQSRAATRISRTLASHGFTVLRYDMPGIGVGR